jgi:excisionase family DNA binding protein
MLQTFVEYEVERQSLQVRSSMFNRTSASCRRPAFSAVDRLKKEDVVMAANLERMRNSTPDARVSEGAEVPDLGELLTVDEVAALLKVSRSWVYEHTRSRGGIRAERLPFIKIGKYTRFDPRSVNEFLRRKSKIA